jgi:hypothetical protein
MRFTDCVITVLEVHKVIQVRRFIANDDLEKMSKKSHRLLIIRYYSEKSEKSLRTAGL